MSDLTIIHETSGNAQNGVSADDMFTDGASADGASADGAPADPEMQALELSVPVEFAITDQRSANWVVRKINEARAYARDVQEWAAAEAQRAQREEAFFLTRFGAQLEQFARERVEQLRDRKSFKLPAGTLGFRAQPLRIHVEDEEAALEWARANCPEAIRFSVELPPMSEENLASWREWFASNAPDARITERLSKTTLNQHFMATGEVPDGAAIDGGVDKFYVR